MSNADLQLSQKLQALCEGLDDVLGEQYGSRVGFVLILAPFNQLPTQVQYVSNVERNDAAGLIRELFDRWQLQLPDIPVHEKN